MFQVQATDRCKHCGDEFANHNYVCDSISKYACPIPRHETSYGHFHGGDPRSFHPDHEMCAPKELANHKKACELWDDAERRGETPTPESCPSGWLYGEDGKAIAHVLRSPYGIGVYTVEFEQFFEAVDHDYEDEPEDDAWTEFDMPASGLSPTGDDD